MDELFLLQEEIEEVGTTRERRRRSIPISARKHYGCKEERELCKDEGGGVERGVWRDPSTHVERERD